MNKIKYLAFSLPVLFVFASGCTGNKSEKKPETVVPQAVAAAPVIGNETLLFLKDLEENGDYVNSQFFPSLIKASVVNSELGPKNLIVDLRSEEMFGKGHLEGAVRIEFSQLP